MALRSILFLALLFAVAIATPSHDEQFLLPRGLRMAKAWQIRALERSRMRLKELLDNLANFESIQKCRSQRRARFSVLQTAVTAARNCRYRGLGYAEYNRLRILCRDRSEIRDDLVAAQTKCRAGSDKDACFSMNVGPLRQKLNMSFEACRSIGWKGDGRPERDGCPSVLALKKELAEVKAIGCGNAGPRERILADIEKTKGRVAYLQSLVSPRPSSQPRPIVN